MKNETRSFRFEKTHGFAFSLIYSAVTLFDLQLGAQNSHLFTYNTFIKILYMFPALPYSSSGGLRRNCIHAASGIVTLCR
jgi:trimethylamine:corrinoid methyltransferase-like protein